MKKYTIKDKSGTKKTIFAKNLAHALTFVDSTKDDAKSLSDALSKHNNNIKDAYVEEWWGQTDESPKAVARRYNLQLTIRARRGDETLYRFTGSNANIERAMDDGYFYSVENEAGKYVKDFITKDEANLPTTLQALVNDEEAAIKAYEVAIKNLESKIDETQMQVLINIMKDERRHVENLYAILNGQVTEKNLEDSIKDAAWKSDNEVYYKFERGYWHVFSIYNRNEMDDTDVITLARRLNVNIAPYNRHRYEKTDRGGYYTDYIVKGKDKNAVIKFCETLNPQVKPLSFSE